MALPFIPYDPVLSNESIVDQLQTSLDRGERHRLRARQLCDQIADVIAELNQTVRRSCELKEQISRELID